MTIRSVAVVGSGLMGSGIAQAVATGGFAVLVHDADAAQWPRARAGIEKSLAKFVEKNQLTSDARDATLARLSFATSLDALADCDLVIEAIVESLEAKQQLWRALEGVCRSDALFATNTSSLSVVDQSVGLAHPERLLGLHCFNPVPMMPLVEVVRSIRTAPAAIEAALAFVQAIGKTPVTARDESGFIVNLLLVPYLIDAVRALEHGTGSIAEIDAAMKLGAGHPMGPLTLLDFVGLDTVVRIGEIMFDQYREPRYAPPPLLRRMVTAGFLGQKSGKGFYDWSGAMPVPMELGL
ncbi:MAG: 3-hydroxyacyl-CoA dehydrogenase family protein [Gemmatimonadales bacterium]